MGRELVRWFRSARKKLIADKGLSGKVHLMDEGVWRNHRCRSVFIPEDLYVQVGTR